MSIKHQFEHFLAQDISAVARVEVFMKIEGSILGKKLIIIRAPMASMHR
jgi:hypothetical protein